ncbi:hypothetical protein K402DRAFT_419818 [Aulographum hederae CBS 113979]|uniref:Protein transport protein Sec61 subunit beta n=1 Tax=Aulographum hederae CBS 113979 TaxID=1176131 RepID=A0A6G1H4S4_9PEZI|nr:hypothetical protein K402DRAFT_419818 [Aulographum hederae CBS 113979]
MSYYDGGSASWSAPGRQPSWEQPAPPSRSGTSSAVESEQQQAFASQFEEVDRALDNLVKSGKFPFGAGLPRRDSMPGPGRPYVDFDPRMAGGPSRHHSVSEFDGMRSHSSSSVQGFYANQRYQPRQSEADQMLQAKRRMAAQREKELRNYHQEQQYNRSVLADMSGAKSDRSMSPNAMSEEERRELIARQHRALYGDNSNLYAGEGGSRPVSQDARVSSGLTGARGNSPLAFDPFGGMQGQNAGDSSVQMPSREGKEVAAGQGQTRSRANSTSSPSSNQNTSFSLFENAQQSSRTSTSSPGGSPPRQGAKASANSAGVAPIGTRPAPASTQAPNPTLSKRSTTPLPSPLSFGFSASGDNNNNNADRSNSTSSNPSSSVADKGVNLGWGSNSGVWGASKNTLGVQASSSPRPTSPVNSPASGASSGRASSPRAPGGPATVLRRKAAADNRDKLANARPASTRAAGAGGSTSTMLKLYTDESPGLKVDPVIVLVLSVGFIISVVSLHVIAKIFKKFSA